MFCCVYLFFFYKIRFYLHNVCTRFLTYVCCYIVHTCVATKINTERIGHMPYSVPYRWCQIVATGDRVHNTHYELHTHSVRVQNLDIHFTHLVRSMALTAYWTCKNLDRRHRMCARPSIVVTRHWIHCATHCPFAGVPYTVLAPQQIKASEPFSSFRGCCVIVHQFIHRFVRLRCSGLISS